MENSSFLFSAGKVGFLRKPFYFVTVLLHNNYKWNGGDKNEKPACSFLWVFVFPKGSHCSVIWFKKL